MQINGEDVLQGWNKVVLKHSFKLWCKCRKELRKKIRWSDERILMMKETIGSNVMMIMMMIVGCENCGLNWLRKGLSDGVLWCNETSRYITSKILKMEATYSHETLVFNRTTV
jgi:hypothetical protein